MPCIGFAGRETVTTHMTIQKIKELLIEDIEYKKPFDAKYPAICDGCHREVETFIFMGDKRKICIDCQVEIQDFLEEK